MRIGPLHVGYCKSGKYRTIIPEKLKIKLAAKFIEQFNNDKTEESLLKEIRKNVSDLRKCFDEGATCEDGDASLARLLFLDGCAVLQFIHSYLLNELEELEINHHQASMIREGLFCLENQIPFGVLELVMRFSNNPDQLKNDIVNFVHMNNMMAPADDLSGHSKRSDILQKKHQNAHLLDLLHKFILLGTEDIGSNNSDNDNNYLHCPVNNSLSETAS